MAIPRIEWECPGCRRRYAIPEKQPRPKLCPRCQNAATEKQKPPAPAAGQAPIPAASELDLDEGSSPVALPLPGSSPSRPVKRPRYQELRTFSVVLKIFAVLIGLLTLVFLAEMASGIQEIPAGPLRRHAVYSCLAIMIGGSTVALMLYAFAVLLLVAVDVEFNTRSE